jgi:AcrR family transcriptional regulator
VVVDEQVRDPAVGTRRERVRAMMRDEILAAARHIVKEEGVKRLSMRALGRAVGVTATTLYDYFPAKEAVLDALYCEGAERLRTELMAAVASTAPGRERLRAFGGAYRRFALENPDLYLLIFGRADAAYQPGEAEMLCAHANFELLVDAVRGAIACGELREGDPVAMAHAAWFLAHGFVSLEIGGFMTGAKRKPSLECGSLDDFFATTMDHLVQGLSPSPAP